MSSHHIVREKQEPALIILSLNGFDQENLGQLLEWSPTVVVNKPIYKEVEELGIKIDAVISEKKEFAVQHNIISILTENAPLEDALKFLVGEQYHAVNIITDYFVLKDYALFAEDINLVVFCRNKKIFTVKPGFSKWQMGSQRIQLMHEVQNLHYSGLKMLGERVFETKKDGFYSLNFDQPFAFIAEEI